MTTIYVLIPVNLFRYPLTAGAAYGSERKGCFEPPHPEILPKSDLICEDLTPIEFATKPTNDQAMNDQSQLVCVLLLSFMYKIFFNG